MRLKMFGLSAISFTVALFSSIIALSIDAEKAPQPDVSSTVSLSSAAQQSSMHPNGPASLRLIDISNHDDVRDWTAVKKNVDGLYMKATEGSTYVDVKLDSYAKGALGQKIPIGFYHYFWPAADLSAAKKQAQFFHNAIKGYAYTLCPVLDVEETSGQPDSVITANVRTFSDEFERLSGQRVMIYCSQSFANRYLSDASLKSYKLWIAHYDVKAPGDTSTWNRYVMWQYGDKLSMAGINGMGDGDIATSGVFINEALMEK